MPMHKRLIELPGFISDFRKHSVQYVGKRLIAFAKSGQDDREFQGDREDRLYWLSRVGAILAVALK